MSAIGTGNTIQLVKKITQSGCEPEAEIIHVCPGAEIEMVAGVWKTGGTDPQVFTVSDTLSKMFETVEITVVQENGGVSALGDGSVTTLAGGDVFEDTVTLTNAGDGVTYCLTVTIVECDELDSLPKWACNAMIVTGEEPECVTTTVNPYVSGPAKLADASTTTCTKAKARRWSARTKLIQIGGEQACLPTPRPGTLDYQGMMEALFGVGADQVTIDQMKPFFEALWNAEAPPVLALAELIATGGAATVTASIVGTELIIFVNGEQTGAVDLGPLITSIAEANDTYVTGVESVVGSVVTLTMSDGTTVTLDLAGLQVGDHVVSGALDGTDLILTLLSGTTVTVPLQDLVAANGLGDLTIVGTTLIATLTDGTTVTVDISEVFDEVCQYILSDCPVGTELTITGTDPLEINLVDGAGNVISTVNVAADVFLNLTDYDSDTDELVFTRNDGTTFTIPVPPILQDLIPAACDVTVCWISGDLTAGSDATFEVEVRETSGVNDLTDITIEYPGGSVGPLTVAAGDSTTQTFVVTLPDPLPYSVDVVVSDVNGIKCRSCLLVSAGGATPVTDHLPVMFGFKGANGTDLRNVAVGDTAVIGFVAAEQSGLVGATGVTWDCNIQWVGPATCVETIVSEETFIGAFDDPGGTYLQTSTTGTPGSNWTQVSDFTTSAEADRFEAALNTILTTGFSRSTTVIPTLSPDPIFNLHDEMSFTTSRPTPTQVRVDWVAAGFGPPSQGVVSPPCPADPDWQANQNSIISLLDSAIGTTNPNLTTIFTTKTYTLNTTYGSVTPTPIGTPATTIAAGTYEETDFEFTMTQEMKDAEFVTCECLAFVAETPIPAIDYEDHLPTVYLAEGAAVTAGDHLPVLEVLKLPDSDGNFWMTRTVGEMVPIQFYVREQSGLADATLTGAFGSVQYVNGDVPPLTDFVNSDSVTFTTAFPLTVPAGQFALVEAEILFTQQMRDAGWVRCTMGVVAATGGPPFPTQAVEDYIYTAEPGTGGGTPPAVAAPAVPEYNALASFADINFLPDDAALVPTIRAAIQSDPNWLATVPVASHTVVGLGNRDFGNWWHAIAAGDEIWDIPSNTLANELFIGRAIFTNDALRWQLSGAAPTASTLLMSNTSVSPGGTPAYVGVFVVLDGAVVAYDSNGINGGTANNTILVDLLPFLNDFERLKFFVVARTGTLVGLTDYLVRYLTIINY